MFKDIVIAIQAYGQAHSFIRKHNLWKWIIIPGIIYMIVFVVSMYFFGKSATSVIEYLGVRSGLNTWIQSMRSQLLGFFFTLAGLILWLILMLFYFSLFKYVWLIVGSPVFAYLSEKTEAILEGKDFPFSFRQLAKDIIRGIGISVRNMLWQSVYLFAILILSLIPIVGWITPVFALLIESYYYGFSMLDYSCERHKLTAAESIEFIGNRKGLAIGNGIMFYLMHWVPVLGWVLAPSYAVIAATLSMRGLKKV
ncbi:EI24 domain-containing protein [Aridibaculum aurantiacum]|uniref:EI24 domain-containing protein n=1 Tax=Aridibaculum aurantiacum TaxID=2810307 RepID=UPI001A969C18|nr:EI24 domain-containing protein [Aridibaculum aurantiacum]